MAIISTRHQECLSKWRTTRRGIHQSTGWIKDKNYPDFVCRLKKALYGLKQAPRAWNQRLVEYLTKCGYNPSIADPSLNMKTKGSKEVYICIYVDDFIITGNDDTWIKDIKGKLGKEFKISDLGELK